MTICSPDKKFTHCENEMIRPFEWLTSPKSLQGLLESLPSRPTVDQIEAGEGMKSSCRSVKMTRDCLNSPRSALHVGSGSSTVGEFLVEEMSYDRVVDADRDQETVERMRERWHQRCTITGIDPNRLQHSVVDFCQGPTAGVADASMDLVLDKSTLDCTLCSENAAASLLVEVYRCLAPGACYVLISFHELELLLPLLQDLPGARWGKVTASTMTRQVEQINAFHSTISPEAIVDETSDEEPNAGINKAPLNSLIAQTASVWNETYYNDDDKSGPDQNHLNWQAVCDHVHEVNNVWFRESQPLLTHQREQELLASFSEPLPLSEAYLKLFTPAEREHLTYEHFLEDWEVFTASYAADGADCLEGEGKKGMIEKMSPVVQSLDQEEGKDSQNITNSRKYRVNETTTISLKIAVEFLKAMQ